MGSDLYKRDFGDSCRHVLDLQLRNSNHVFDGAGENIQYHSDSESLSSKKSKTRYINSAIYVESVESSHSVTSLQTDSSCPDDVTPHPHGTCRSYSTPLLTGRVSEASSSSVKSRKSIRLAIGEVDAEETPRCNRTYRGEGPDGQDTFRLSVASLSTTSTAKEERDRNERKKQEAFKQWVARKEQEKRERERLRFESLKRQEAPAPTAEQREESFRRWMERKRRQAERRRADELMTQYRDQEKLDQERLKREQAKEEKLTDWVKRKEEDMKLMKTREERRTARIAIEEERRRVKGERAYRDWLRTSKNKPLPVPLNQGELSMRGSVSQMYINPKPWQSTI